MKHLVLLLSALTLVACSRPAAVQEPVRAVKTVRVGTEAYAAGVEFSGEVRARVESRLGFRVGGKLARRSVEVGQRVRSGDTLAELDSTDYYLAVKAARAQQDAANAQRDQAAADFRRFAALREQGFISSAELERRETALRAARAQLDQAQTQWDLQVNQAQYSRLQADVSGVVTAVEAEVGQVLAAGQAVVRLAVDGPRDVVFAVPEDKVSAIAVGQAVRLRPWAQPGEWGGRVREVAASADALTRTFQVKVAVEPGAPLMLGATVSVSVPGLGGGGLQGRPVIKLPTTALRQEGAGSAVWLIDEASMTVRLQPVQVATADGNEAVIAAGLSPGQLVVSAGVHVLSPGQKVSLFGAAPATATPAATPAPAPAR